MRAREHKKHSSVHPRSCSHDPSTTLPPAHTPQQAPSTLSLNPETGKKQVVEIKAEVFWGRAYSGVITDIKNYGHGASVATRGIRSLGHPEGESILFKIFAKKDTHGLA